MKKLIFVLFTLSTLIFACQKADTTSPTTNATDVKSSISTGQWTISLYRQKTEDKTSAFSGYVFVFDAAGTVSATKNGKTLSGTWSYSPPTASYYGAPAASASFTLTMTSSSDFTKLSKTWDVNSGTTLSDIKLDNKEPLEDEHLEFVK